MRKAARRKGEKNKKEKENKEKTTYNLFRHLENNVCSFTFYIEIGSFTFYLGPCCNACFYLMFNNFQRFITLSANWLTREEGKEGRRFQHNFYVLRIA